MRYALIKNGLVDNVILLDDGSEWQPPKGYKLIATDTGNVGDAYEGEVFVPPASPELPAAIPGAVSSRQFWLGCDKAEIYDQVQAFLAAQPRAVRLASEYSATFLRDDAMMQAGFAALGKKPDEIDAFFVMCSRL